MNKARNNNIILIGHMGAGKSSVGKFLATQLGMDFYDSDEEIEKSTGVDLGWIFDVEGEEGFRKRETAVIKRLVQRHNIVLATGGGTVMTPENQVLLKEKGSIVYLSVTLPFQKHRVINDSRRPLLQVKNREEVLERLLHEREPVYQALAELQVITDNRTVKAVANDILEWLN